MTQTITIDPVTRLEGHGKITIYLNDQGEVENAQFHVTQVRGFERFSQGRPFYEMPSLTARICGICPVSHLLASAKACEAIMSVRIPHTAAQLRRILNLAVELGQGASETRIVADVAAATPVLVDESTTVRVTVDLMNKRGLTAIIATKDGAPSGIFTERDLLKRVAAQGIDAKATAIKQVMTAPIIKMPRSALVGDVLAEMYRQDIRNMPVSGTGGELVGLLSMPEILQYATAFNIDEQVRRTWKEVAEFMDSEDQYTPG